MRKSNHAKKLTIAAVVPHQLLILAGGQQAELAIVLLLADLYLSNNMHTSEF